MKTFAILVFTLLSIISYSQTLVYTALCEGSTPFPSPPASSLEIGSWSYALRSNTDTVFEATKSGRFEIRKSQPLVHDGKRSEVVAVKPIPQANMWYSYAVYFPSVGYEYDATREIINQWYQNGTPSFTLRTQADKIYVEFGSTTDNRKKYAVATITKNQWHKIVLHVNHSSTSTGQIEMWYDSVKVFNKTGGNMYPVSSTNPMPKFKFGLYKSSFKDGTSKQTKRIIFFDKVRIATTATFLQMNP